MVKMVWVLGQAGGVYLERTLHSCIHEGQLQEILRFLLSLFNYATFEGNEGKEHKKPNMVSAKILNYDSHWFCNLEKNICELLFIK